MVVLSSLQHLLLSSVWTFVAVFSGLFDSVFTENGFEHYAEKPTTLYPFLQPFMLGNTLVNFGYVAIGLLWLKFARNLREDGLINDEDVYMFCMMAWMSMLYGAVQFCRIVTQWHEFAVLDQWFTLPIFIWVYIWCLQIKYGWKKKETLAIIIVSFSSYCLAFMFKQGFEVALGLHVLFVFTSTMKLYRRYPGRNALHSYTCGIVCCAGFVGLKLLDHELGKVHIIFQMLSGHFWSKIADFLQIHFVAKFFLYILMTKNKREN